MNELKSGMLVQHASLGLGKVVAVEATAVHVFFDAAETRFATKLRLPFAATLLTPARTENAWLSAMATFARDARSGRYALAQSWVTQREAMARFTEAFPDGFADPAVAPAAKDKRARATKWRAAHAAFVELLGNGEGERLLASGSLAELASRALTIERNVASLCSAPEKAALATALADPAACGDFFSALFALLAAPAPETRARFDALASAAADLPRAAPGAAWIVTTLLPAIAQPERHVLVRPKATCDAAHRLGFDVKYDAEPNWRTYAALLDVSGLILASLRSAGARDFIDVETFVHETGTRTATARANAA